MNNRYFFPSLSDPAGFPTTQYELQEACISLEVAGKSGKSGNEETEIFSRCLTAPTGYSV